MRRKIKTKSGRTDSGVKDNEEKAKWRGIR